MWKPDLPPLVSQIPQWTPEVANVSAAEMSQAERLLIAWWIDSTCPGCTPPLGAQEQSIKKAVVGGNMEARCTEGTRRLWNNPLNGKAFQAVLLGVFPYRFIHVLGMLPYCLPGRAGEARRGAEGACPLQTSTNLYHPNSSLCPQKRLRHVF